MRFPILPAILAAASLGAQTPVQSFRLPTGLTCLLMEDHERPLVRMELAVRWDPSEPGVASGQVGFLAALLADAGAGPFRDRAALNRFADEQGVVHAFQVRRDGFRWSLLSDSRAQETAFAYLAHAVFRPGIEGPLVEALRSTLQKRALALEPKAQAMEAFRWGLGDPAAVLPPAGAGLERMDWEALLQLHRHLVRPEKATLLLYGDLNLSQARELATLHLGVWGPSPTPAPAAKTVSVPALAPFSAFLASGRKAELWAGAVRSSMPSAADPLLPLLLERRARLCGEDLKVEIFLEGAGPLLIKASAREAAKDALAPGLRSLLEGLRTQGFSQEDLDHAKWKWRVRREALSLHPADQVAEVLGGGLAPDLLQAVERVSLEEVNRIMAAWVRPEALRFLLLDGDADLVKAAEKAGMGKPELLHGHS